jgi:hypothetical protein
MEITKFSEPYPHVIIDNFFNDEILENIENIFKNYRKSFRPYTHRKNRYAIDVVTIPIVMKYIHSMKEIIMDACEKEIVERFGKKLNYDDIKLMEHKICLDHVGYNIPKHCDTSKKVITIVVYINELGSTTTLFDHKFENSKQIAKKKNSALVFVPKDKYSWHEVEETNHERHTVQIMYTLNL